VELTLKSTTPGHMEWRTANTHTCNGIIIMPIPHIITCQGWRYTITART
jgi:hypothetical protein